MTAASCAVARHAPLGSERGRRLQAGVRGRPRWAHWLRTRRAPSGRGIRRTAPLRESIGLTLSPGAPAEPLQGLLIDRVDALEEYVEAWDDLAVTAARPYCAPAWQLAWWRHVAPADAYLRVAVALDTGTLVGVAPFYAERLGSLWSYRLLAASICFGVEPLCKPGAERPAAEAFAAALARVRPRVAVLTFKGVPVQSPWPTLLADSWPARRPPRVTRGASTIAPKLEIGCLTFESWLKVKSSNFRSGLARDRRRLEEHGARFGVTGLADLGQTLEALGRLHHERMAARGGFSVLDRSVEEMLCDAGQALVPSGRMRLFHIEVAGETISAHLFLTAGGEVAYWLGGFDHRWAARHPALATLLYAIEDAFERGDARIDLGGGAQRYKYRFANGEAELFDWRLIPRGPSSLLTRIHLAPASVRSRLAHRIPSKLRTRIRRRRRALRHLRTRRT